MSSGPFLDLDRYPELDTLTAAWREIRAEAITTLPHMSPVTDRRVTGDWNVLPFWVEDDDRHVVSDEACDENRLLAPLTVSLIEAFGPVESASFSSLAPRAAIAEHRHHRPFATASLCLDGDEKAVVRVAGETRSYANGEWIIFDYTQPHEVINHGSEARLVLLVFVEPRV